MRNEGLGSWPARRARRTPHRAALVHGGATTSYAELHDRTTRLAHALRARGVRRGDRIAYLGPNHPSFLETLFAAGVLGAVLVPLNTRLTAPELTHQLTDSGATVLVHAPAHAELVTASHGGSRVRTSLQVGAAYEAAVAGAADEPFDEPVAPGDTCLVLYTSGTTGRPKGAMLSHANLTWNAVNLLVDQDLRADERALVSAPLFHIAGLAVLTLPVLLKGGTCVLTAAFDPGETLDLIEHHRISYMFGVPAMYERIARHPRWAAADLSSLRMLSCGGAPVPTPLIDTYQARGLTFLQGYGTTEALGVLLLDGEHSVRKAGSAGVPHFFADVTLAGPGPGLPPVAPGGTGEVLVRGPAVMSGYWGLPEETAAAFTDGWFRTGDAARLDRDGHARIVDRIKDVIISGGENVYPAEVEDRLLAHPGIAECAVIGVPDATWGEVPRAVVVPCGDASPDPEEVLRSLSGQLAKYKIPKSLVITTALPRTASGKILKQEVRERYGTAPPPGDDA